MIRKSPKTEFTDAFYTQKTDTKNQIVYLNIEDDVLQVHPTKLQNGLRIIDTNGTSQLYQKEMNSEFKNVLSFTKQTLDIDFLTIPLKYRPAQNGVPPQLNTNLNGAVYLGFRNDKYQVSYLENPLKKSDRNINHYGFSLGAFSGFGNTAMTPTTTNNYLTTEYDGIVWSKGVSGIIAINNFTLGLAVGFDNLVDKNRPLWIYENKTWLGLAFGLNLN